MNPKTLLALAFALPALAAPPSVDNTKLDNEPVHQNLQNQDQFHQETPTDYELLKRKDSDPGACVRNKPLTLVLFISKLTSTQLSCMVSKLFAGNTINRLRAFQACAQSCTGVTVGTLRANIQTIWSSRPSDLGVYAAGHLVYDVWSQYGWGY